MNKQDLIIEFLKVLANNVTIVDSQNEPGIHTARYGFRYTDKLYEDMRWLLEKVKNFKEDKPNE